MDAYIFSSIKKIKNHKQLVLRVCHAPQYKNQCFCLQKRAYFFRISSYISRYCYCYDNSILTIVNMLLLKRLQLFQTN